MTETDRARGSEYKLPALPQEVLDPFFNPVTQPLPIPLLSKSVHVLSLTTYHTDMFLPLPQWQSDSAGVILNVHIPGKLIQVLLYKLVCGHQILESQV